MPNLHKSFHGASAVCTAGLVLILWVVHPQGDSDDSTPRTCLANVSGSFGQNQLRGLVNQMCKQTTITSSYRLCTGSEYLIHWLIYSTEIRSLLWSCLSRAGSAAQAVVCTGSWRAALVWCFVCHTKAQWPPSIQTEIPSLKCHFLSLSTRLKFVPHKVMPQISNAESYPLGQSSVYFIIGAGE